MSETVALPPLGFRVRLSADTHRCADGATLYGGAGSIVRLHPRARERLTRDDLLVDDRLSARLARTLLDRGLAQPDWAPLLSGAADTEARTLRERVTVVVPVRDRPASLHRLLASLPPVAEVIVVDDASLDRNAIADTAHPFGVRVVHRRRCGGPSAARNEGLRLAGTPLVLFVDSDVRLRPGCAETLARHFEDPAVAAVAPRIAGDDRARSSLARYEAAHSSLDMGPTPARVAPGTRVSYVPSAVLLVRRDLVGSGFDETMAVAEDVDLVWRLGRTHTVRYDPRATAVHEHRTRPGAWFARKALYGTGAADLAARHGDAVAPAVLSPWSAVVTAAALAQRWWSLPVAATATVLAQQALARRLTFSSTPQRSSAQLMAMAVRGTAQQTCSALTRHYVPVTLAAAPFSVRARRALVLATVVGGVLDHRRTGSRLSTPAHVALHAADDLAYGIGLWTGAIRARSVAALTPRYRGRTAGR